MDADQIKALVKKKYSEIALQGSTEGSSSCCGSSDCCEEAFNMMQDDYASIPGYAAEADLGLGCGLPTEFAKIKAGDTVVDLGSGAGNDCFVARAETGATGKVIGIDFTPAMVDQARYNAEKIGFNNVEFRLGDIEKMPLTSAIADVVVSNCVLNLVPNKKAAFREIHRILKPQGHFSISDIVLTDELPEQLKSAAELYAGCVAGAIQKSEYLEYVRDAGFQNIVIQKERAIHLPEELLRKYLSDEDVASYKRSPDIIRSITLYAEKGRSCCSSYAKMHDDKCC